MHLILVRWSLVWNRIQQNISWKPFHWCCIRNRGMHSHTHTYIHIHPHSLKGRMRALLWIGIWDSKFGLVLPFSCFRRLRLLQIFTAQTDKMIATIKNRMPPTTPAVIALCLTRAGTGNLTSSLDSYDFSELAKTRK